MTNCSQCRVKLEKKQIGPAVVDECPSCGGIWFEKDEFRQAKDAVDGDLNWLDFEVWRQGDGIAVSRSEIACPSCGKTTVSLACGTTGVTIDYCEDCQGAWLAKGEFKRIIDALESEVDSKSLTGYVKASLEEARDILTGPESFVSEWKDFSTVVRLLQYRLFVEHPGAVRAIMSIHRAVH